MAVSTPYFRIQFPEFGSLLGVVSISTGTVFFSMMDIKLILRQKERWAAKNYTCTIADIIPTETDPCRRQTRVIEYVAFIKILQRARSRCEPESRRLYLQHFFLKGFVVKTREIYYEVELKPCEKEIPESVPIAVWIRKFSNLMLNPYS